MRAGIAALLVGGALAACSPTTTRPRVTPLPASPSVEIKGKPSVVAERMLRVLAEDSVPLADSSAQDAWAVSPWLDGETFRPVDRRPVGPNTVRFRAWVDPGRPNYSVVTLETSYRPLADPSVPDRELDRAVPEGHPAQARMAALLEKIRTAR
ncbi:MAG TPA: hypothetical protein VFX50_19100 [Gemmatimonadales bacterium]|nr:hypothetical protein [Gemmatimonadales bacterium]